MTISRPLTARLAGLFYLCVAITGFWPHWVTGKLVVSGDAAATATNILESPLLYTTGMVSNVVMTAFWIAAAVALYAVLCRGRYEAPGMAMVLAGSNCAGPRRRR